jgi:hypothetical protein
MTNINTFQGDVFIHEYIKHTGDDNTYFGFSGDDTIVMRTAGTDRLTVNSSGNVTLGVNLVIPDYIYHSGDLNNLFGFSGTDTFKIATAGVDRLTVGNEGHVSIGVNLTIPNYIYHTGDSNTYFGFYADDTIVLRTAGTTALTISSGTESIFGGPVYVPDYIYHVGDSTSYFGWQSNAVFVLHTNGTEALSVASDQALTCRGVVDIASYVRHIGDTHTYFGFSGNDNIAFYSGGTHAADIAGNGTFRFYHSMYMADYIYHYSDNNTYFGFSTNDTFVVATSGSSKMTINPQGHMGLGIAPSTSHTFQCSGAIHHIGFWQTNQNSCYVSAQNGIGTRCYFGADGQGFITPETTSVGFYNSSTGNMNYFNNGQRRAILGSDGRFYAQNFAIYSDERIKDNITDVDDAKSLEIIKQLQPRNYVMRENRDEKKWGFIAQEVEQVVPEVVNSIGTGTVCINKKYAITEYNPPVKLADIVYSNVSIADYATLDANVQVYYLGPDSSNTYYSNIVTDAIYSKSNVSALITDEVFVVDDCVKLSIDETYSLNVCCLNVSSVSSNVYVFQDDCRMTADDHDLPDMNPTDFIYIKSKEIEDTKTIDFGFMNPVLVSAMQQLIRTVDDLKERVTVLENI